MTPRILFVTNFYPEFLAEIYRNQPGLASMDFREQRSALFSTNFGAGDAYSANVNALGGDAQDVICNADALQARWAKEHGLTDLVDNIHDRRRQILAEQIIAYQPDILYVFEWSPLGDKFLVEMKQHVPLIVGQVASSLPANRTYAGYDMMLSSWPPIVEHFRMRGMESEHLRLGFDERILSRLGTTSKQHDVTFVGGFAPCHESRVAWLERILEDVPVDIYGYGIERVTPDSRIHQHHRGTVWGTRMFEVLAQSRITLHLQADIDVAGHVSNGLASAMRFYEATGVGACLVTPSQPNMVDLFEPGIEVAAYDDIESGIAIIKSLLADPETCENMSRAGQERTTREHAYRHRMMEVLDILAGVLAPAQ
ncbi:MAG: glycosyltransferase family protein [Planctomycetota bacterium]